jgi:hypothetical protein
LLFYVVFSLRLCLIPMMASDDTLGLFFLKVEEIILEDRIVEVEE